MLRFIVIPNLLTFLSLSNFYHINVAFKFLHQSRNLEAQIFFKTLLFSDKLKLQNERNLHIASYPQKSQLNNLFFILVSQILNIKLYIFLSSGFFS